MRTLKYHKHLVCCHVPGSSGKCGVIIMIGDNIIACGLDLLAPHGEHWDVTGRFLFSMTEGRFKMLLGGLDTGELLFASGNLPELNDLGTERSKQTLAHVTGMLARMGSTPTDLAKDLCEIKITLVIELCEDAVEEHVHSYRVSKVFLIGINRNVVDFTPFGMEFVREFIDEWEFEPCDCVGQNSCLDPIRSRHDCT